LCGSIRPVSQLEPPLPPEQFKIREALSNTQGTNALVRLFSKKFVRAKRHENQEPGGNLERLAATRWSADRKLRGTSGLDALWHRGRLNQ
jgi:hypothetical protein